MDKDKAPSLPDQLHLDPGHRTKTISLHDTEESTTSFDTFFSIDAHVALCKNAALTISWYLVTIF